MNFVSLCVWGVPERVDVKKKKIEICSVANGATKKEIGRAKEYIVKQLGLEKGDNSMEMGTIHAGDFMVRIPFCP